MAYNLADRLDYLGTRMRELNQNFLVYQRGASETTVWNFTPEKVDVNQLALFGIVLVTEKMMDFVFDADELEAFSPSHPQEGDKIVFDHKTYEVISDGTGVFNFTTTSRKRIRVHGKQIA